MPTHIYIYIYISMYMLNISIGRKRAAKSKGQERILAYIERSSDSIINAEIKEQLIISLIAHIGNKSW